MRLLSSPVSPFGRKVKITAAMTGVSDRLRIEYVDTNPPDNEALRGENPLSKIPVLILPDGTQLFDSTVICEYLDSLTPSPRLFPAAGAERYNTLTLGALGDGIMEAGLLIVYERRFRPEDKWVEAWLARQQNKIDAGLRHLEMSPPAWGEHPDYGHITIACALGYLDLRHGGAWRSTHPRLIEWLGEFAAAVPSFEATRPPPA